MADELPLNDNARLPEQDRRAGVIMVAEGLRCYQHPNRQHEVAARISTTVKSSGWSEDSNVQPPNKGGFFMATNSKETQKKADAKRAGKRARAWWGVLYPESAPENWRDMIANDLVETLISPLHDKDVLPNGEPKKAHYHVLISFKNPTTRAAAAETMKRWGVVVQEHWPKPGEPDSFKVKDFKQAARYLCHLDQADKHRYEISDVQSIGAIDYAALVMSATDEDAMLDEIFDTMDTYGLDSYPAVVRWTRNHHPEWKPIVYRKYTRQISEYAKGLSFEGKRGYAAGVETVDGSMEQSATTGAEGSADADPEGPRSQTA